MNRRNFFQASVSPLVASLVAPKLESIFEPLRLHAQESSKADSLTITRVEPYVVRVGAPSAGRGRAGGEGGGRPYPCVRIETAEGIHGWGEGTTPPTTPAVITQIRESGKLLLGKSAWDIEGHWQQIYTTEFNTLGGTLFAAMSAIDLALWDIVGKKLGVPAYKLLGGRAIPDRKSLRIYASQPWPNAERTRTSYREKTKEIMAKGATAGKTDFFGNFTPVDRELPTKTFLEAREMIAGVREASAEFDICVEMHAKFNTHTAARIMKMCEPFDVFWCEEPVPPEDVDAMAQLQHSINVPIATGESLQSHYNFREVLEKGACRVLQPDLARVGGLTAAKKIAGMAEAYYINIAPHNPNGPICTAASLHLVTSIANFLILEQGASNTAAYKDIFPGGWKESLSEMWVPEVPGIGVDFSPAYLKEHTVPL
jgi:galactonate dehydratase